ncbi:MAG: nucleotide exchange factor GrpE [Terriglobales bacterium]
MRKPNGNSEVEPAPLDVEHELPPAEEDGFVEQEKPRLGEKAAGPPAAENELAKLKAERDLLLDRLARQQAEFENARKRAAREQREFKDFAVGEAVVALLPVLDSFDNALKIPAAGEEMRAGIELIRKQLHDALARLGVRVVPAAGTPFDPHLHQAVEVVETTEAEDNHVLEEMQRGYRLKERLLRPAMVRVARNSKPRA